MMAGITAGGRNIPKATAPVYPDVVLADSPLFYYRLEEPSGDITDEVDASTLTANSPGSIAYAQPGAIGNGMIFSGGFFSGTEVTPSGPKSYELSVKLETGSSDINSYPVFRNNTFDVIFSYAGDNTYSLFTSSGFGTSNLTITVPRDDSWHHLVFIYDGSEGRAYLDGAHVDTHSASGTFVPNSTLQIGRSGGSAYNGGIDEVSFYGYALTPTQIAAHYAAWAAAQP